MWTATALASEVYPARELVWRVVEHQHTASTRKLVGTHAEQALLEGLLEDSKPPYPLGTEKLHYLLKTPFRYYPPNPYGSRFRRPAALSGAFYASLEKRTAMAEMAYYRLRFFQDAPGCPMPTQEHKLTAFSVQYQTEREINLQRAPFLQDSAQWTHPTDYSATQAIADLAREANIDAIRYQSVRDPQHGSNIALLTFTAFTSQRPRQEQTWYMHFSDSEVIATRPSSQLDDEAFLFEKEQLLATQQPARQNTDELATNV